MTLGDETTLDIEALVKYSGQGRCNIATLARYSKELRTWARSRNWGEFWLQVPWVPVIDETVFKILN